MPSIPRFLALSRIRDGNRPHRLAGLFVVLLLIAHPAGPARAGGAMVAVAHPLAAEAGLGILERGGSAVDAAIAMQMVLNLVEPQSSGIGGGGFLLAFEAGSGEISAYDGRETVPAKARPDLFLDEAGRPKSYAEAVPGGASVGVPGLLRMLDLAHRDHGRLPWAELFVPAIRLAQAGFPIGQRLHRMLALDRHLRFFPRAAAYFYQADGSAKPVGTILRNPGFARTLREIAGKGAAAFYRGPIARDIVDAVHRTPFHPRWTRGTMAEADLAAYRAKRRAPLCRVYRVYRVCGMPPPSSGGIAVLQALALLEPFDLAALRPGSLAAVHLISEASRLAFADRNAYVADPDFVSVPVGGLLDGAYLRRRSRMISPERSLGRALPGTPPGAAKPSPPFMSGGESGSTTHMSIVDARGNAVAFTSSIESAFGSRLMVRGFLLNNQLTDFSFLPEIAGVGVANRVAAGKRPRSSMAPTLVLRDDGALRLSVGSPGGPRIIGYVVETLVAVLDWGLGIQEAIDLPRHVTGNGAMEIEVGTDLEALISALKAKGHRVAPRELVSGLHGILVTEGTLSGGADRRREGVARAPPPGGGQGASGVRSGPAGDGP